MHAPDRVTSASTSPLAGRRPGSPLTIDSASSVLPSDISIVIMPTAARGTKQLLQHGELNEVAGKSSVDGISPVITIVAIPIRQRPAPTASGEEKALAATDNPGARRRYAIAKRTVDVLVAATALLMLVPLLLVIAIMIKSTSSGAAFYSQTRCGKDGRPFVCHKFRTMVADADAVLMRDAELRASFLKEWKLTNDPRVTRVGHFLRMSSIDELPQLWNVIRGEMSLVGPRPVQYDEIRDFYGECASLVNQVRPGMTGLWQISGRSTTGYDRRVELDVEYVRTCSFMTDMLILVKTLPAIIMTRGAI